MPGDLISYPALKHPLLSHLHLLSDEEKQGLHQATKQLVVTVQKIKGTTQGEQQEAVDSIFNNSYVKASPAAGGVLAFATAMKTTIDGWDDASLGTRAYEVIGLLAMVYVALSTLLIYWKNTQQAEISDAKKQKLAQITAIKGTAKFLKRSEQFARTLLKGEPGKLAEQFDVFNQYLLSVKCGTTPNPLVQKWTEAALLTDQPDQLKALVEKEILPRIKQYASHLNKKLEKIEGHAPHVEEADPVEIAVPEEVNRLDIESSDEE